MKNGRLYICLDRISSVHSPSAPMKWLCPLFWVIYLQQLNFGEVWILRFDKEYENFLREKCARRELGHDIVGYITKRCVNKTEGVDKFFLDYISTYNCHNDRDWDDTCRAAYCLLCLQERETRLREEDRALVERALRIVHRELPYCDAYEEVKDPSSVREWLENFDVDSVFVKDSWGCCCIL
jgi:uncharacterized protein YggL (DUF469 family)